MYDVGDIVYTPLADDIVSEACEVMEVQRMVGYTIYRLETLSNRNFKHTVSNMYVYGSKREWVLEILHLNNITLEELIDG